MDWQTSRRSISLDQTLVMGVLNVTPDSFSDGGKFLSKDDALRQAEQMIAEGADIIDVGGESTRPGSKQVSVDDEIARTVPVIKAVVGDFGVPVSIDTTKFEVAKAALEAGAEIINDISGLRFDERLADLASQNAAGLVLMHSRGTYETLHSQVPVEDILTDVTADLRRSINAAKKRGVANEQIVLDVGIGFGKTPEQNLELIAKLGKLKTEFSDFPILVGASRKSFIGKLLDDAPVKDRLAGSVAAAAIASWNGANIVRVHDVRETSEALKVIRALKGHL